ncbi:MAG TPA: PfkB family carbohydrate kinase, partial [Pirellulales bacterium]|nr:PfkB family carbohydrate kinase [Pirellulales bacterium]
WLLVQNETSAVDHAIRRAKDCGLRVALNPAPFDSRVLCYPLELVDLLCLNEVEGAAMTGLSEPEAIWSALAGRLVDCEVVLTMGAAGVIGHGSSGAIHVSALPVRAVDTTAAGDTFLGYYLASRNRGIDRQESLEVATRAAALCVTKYGAIDSIPRWDAVQAFV